MKRMPAIAAVAAVCGILACIFVTRHPTGSDSLPALISERGTPDFMAIDAQISPGKFDVLRIIASGENPKAVTNWVTISNTTLIWAESTACQFNAKCFYDEMSHDTNFNGWAWHPSRSFLGEKLTIVKFDEHGRGAAPQLVNVDAVSVLLNGFKGRPPVLYHTNGQ